LSLSPGFTDYVLELLTSLGGVSARRMFGGAGLFRDGVMFALLDDDVIYVRVNDALQADLQAQGSIPWVYSMKRDGGLQVADYWRMPETATDDPEEASAIAKRAYAAALIRKTLRERKPAKKKAAKSPKSRAPAKAARKRVKSNG